MTQWLRLCTSSAKDTGLIPGQGTKIPHAMWHSQKKPPVLMTLPASVSPCWGFQLLPSGKARWLVYILKIGKLP